jgi:hypothetical protein
MESFNADVVGFVTPYMKEVVILLIEDHQHLVVFGTLELNYP